MAYLGNSPTRGQFRKLTDISAGFNGVTTSFTLSVPPGTAAYYVTPTSPYSLIISVNNVIKNPDVDYTTSGSTITFTTAPAGGATFFGIICGDPLNGTVPADGTVNASKLATTGGSPGQTYILNSSYQFEWNSPASSITGANNTFTGANTFANATGQVFTGATSTRDGIVLVGNTNGTTSNRVTIIPASLTGNQTLTLPNASGTVVLAGANNAFTGANTFYNTTGQVFGTATSTNDGILLSGRAGGTSSYRATLTPGTLTASRTITLPDVSGTVVTTGDTGSVTNTMLAGSIANAKLTNSTITINGNPVALGGSITVSGAVTNSVTFDNTGAGGVSGSSFNGSSALTVSYNTIGAVGLSGNNTFTGTNTFSNSSGQTFTTATSTNDGIVLSGRAGGTLSYRSTLTPTTLTANRTLTLPDVSGTIVTTGSTAVVTGSMVAGTTLTDSNISNTAAIAVSKLAYGTARYVLQTNAAGTAAEWTNGLSISTLTASGSVSFTGGVTASTSPVVLQGQNALQFADADSSNYVAFKCPATVTSNVTWTLPAADGSSNQVLTTNGTGTLSWASPGGGGDVVAANNNAFTGANTFYNTTGQTFSSTSATDGLIIKGNGTGTSSWRLTVQPASLTAARTITLPNISGTVITNSDTATVTNTMLVNSSATINGTAVSLGGSATVNTANAATFNNSNSGVASGTTFNGSAAITVSANTLGAASLGAGNAFTGANTFFNTTGQTIGGSATTNDALVFKGNGAGTSSWRLTVQPATLSASRTLTLPNVTGTVITTGDSGTVTSTMLTSGIIDSILPSQTGNSGKVLTTNGSTASWGNSLIVGSAQNANTLTAVSFTGIPSWAKRVTLYFTALSTGSANGNVVAQVGTSSGYETSGYAGVFTRLVDNSAVNCGNDGGLTGAAIIQGAVSAAASTYYGFIRFTYLSGNTWVYEKTVSPASSGANNQLYIGAGSKTLAGTLDRIQITALSDTFDAGTVNIAYE